MDCSHTCNLTLLPSERHVCKGTANRFSPGKGEGCRDWLECGGAVDAETSCHVTSASFVPCSPINELTQLHDHVHPVQGKQVISIDVENSGPEGGGPIRMGLPRFEGHITVCLFFCFI